MMTLLTIPLLRITEAHVRLVAEIFGDPKVGHSVPSWTSFSICGTLLVLFNRLIHLKVNP